MLQISPNFFPSKQPRRVEIILPVVQMRDEGSWSLSKVIIQLERSLAGLMSKTAFRGLIMAVSLYPRIYEHNCLYFPGLEVFSLLGTWYVQRCFPQDTSIR